MLQFDKVYVFFTIQLMALQLTVCIRIHHIVYVV